MERYKAVRSVEQHDRSAMRSEPVRQVHEVVKAPDESYWSRHNTFDQALTGQG